MTTAVTPAAQDTPLADLPGHLPEFGWDTSKFGWRGRSIFLIALAFSSFQIYTAAFNPLSSGIVRAVHVGFLLLMTFVLLPGFSPRSAPWPKLSWAFGIAGFVLKYRLGSGGYRHPVMLGDAARAVRLVRARAADWQVDPKRVGIMGSSAGGHLASTLLTHFDAGDANATDVVERQSSRPDVGILCYAVISMGTNTHQGSKNNLLGKDPSPELVKLLSNELQVTPQTPPCFLWHTWEDGAVKVENTLDFAQALRRAGVRFDLHIYEKGNHGLGLGSGNYDPSKWMDWTRDCTSWLKVQGFGHK